MPMLERMNYFKVVNGHVSIPTSIHVKMKDRSNAVNYHKNYKATLILNNDE